MSKGLLRKIACKAVWLRRVDSNHRLLGYEPKLLPLHHSAMIGALRPKILRGDTYNVYLLSIPH